MSIDAKAAHRLHTKLEKVLGSDEAATLMSAVPPVQWENVVTKDYLDLRLDSLKNELLAAIATSNAAVNDRFAQMAQAMASQTRTIVFSVIGSFLAFAGLVVALLR